MGRIEAWLAVFLVAGCASPPKRAEVTQSGFPTPEALKGVARAPLPGAVRTPEAVDVVEWALEGPFPADPKATLASASPWERLLLEEIAARGSALIAPESMGCVARELGRFRLQNGGDAPASLEAFVIGRCQASVARAGMSWLSGKVPDAVAPEELFGQWKEQVKEMIRRVPSGAHAVGIWFGRHQGTAVFAVASGPRYAQLAAVESVTATTAELLPFKVRGELLIPAASVRALINRGRFGVAPCTVGEVKLPAFEITCAAAAKEAAAWIEIGAYPEGRFLGKTVLSVMVWPGGTPPEAYRREDRARDVRVESADELGAELAGAINAVRAEAGLRPLKIEARQNGTAKEVAPYYFAAAFGALPESVLETVALGMRAGWDIEALIRYGLFSSVSSAGTHDVAALVSAAVERPFGREVVLDPGVDRVAIGPFFSTDPPFLGAVISTYATLDRLEPDALVSRFMKRLDQARAEAGHAPGKLVPELEPDARSAAMEVTQGAEPQDALQGLMEAGAHRMRSAVSGWVIEANALDDLKLPDELVRTTNLKLAVGIGFRRPSGEPWGRYVVLVVLEAPRETGTTTARLDVPRPPVDRPGTPEG